MGGGLAIPHARMEQVREPACAFIRTRKPVPFAAPDHKPVSQVLALLVPTQCNDLHLRLLAAAAGVFSDKLLCDELSRCARCDEVRERIAQWDEPVPKAAAR